MSFISFEFTIFFSTIFILYWFIFNKYLRIQNLFILTGSYFFYGWWDWRFLVLLISSSILYYFLGIFIHKSNNIKKRKAYIIFGLLYGLGSLFYFKYFNFFILSLLELFSVLNVTINIQTLNLILPLGISFYTFRMISYILDIDKEEIVPVKNLVDFCNYVSFFPALLSGPIDKPRDFIPQLQKERTFKYQEGVDGIRQILWGLFKKIVIADNCAIYTKQIFDNYSELSGSSLFLGAFLFAIQLYADFSGYTDMAIGFSRLIGFNVTKNFNFPFFAQNIAEFWQKWHISLTSWLTEYVFMPLNFSFRKYKKAGIILAVIINFVLCGLWHGDRWTYVVFGLLHGLYFIPLILKGTMNVQENVTSKKILPTWTQLRNILGTFLLVMITFIFFLSETVSKSLEIISRIFSKSFLSFPEVVPKKLLFIIVIFILAEWLQRFKEHGLQLNNKLVPNYVRIVIYITIVTTILVFEGEEQPFIYFQF